MVWAVTAGGEEQSIQVLWLLSGFLSYVCWCIVMIKEKSSNIFVRSDCPEMLRKGVNLQI